MWADWHRIVQRAQRRRCAAATGGGSPLLFWVLRRSSTAPGPGRSGSWSVGRGC